MSTDIQTVEAKIHRIPGASIDDVADALSTLDGLAQRIKQLQAAAMAAIKERIKESGAFQVGDNLYTLAKPKKEKDRDVAATTARMLEVVQGDLGKFVGCLSVNAFKPGTVKRVLEEFGVSEEWDVLFETTYNEKVEVVKVNLAFAGK
jgi:hypothetical protein